MARVGAVQKSSTHRLETGRLVKFLRAQVMGGGYPWIWKSGESPRETRASVKHEFSIH